MPKSRPAKYHISCLDSSVFLDFDTMTTNGNNNDNDDGDGGRIYLRRISFDGYGCCNIKESCYQPLNAHWSKEFRRQWERNDDKEFVSQTIMTNIVLEAIRLNEANIWPDALNHYHLRAPPWSSSSST
ncbi:hypothetical protein ACA910_019514 [Epithemia clementina (nom. ined.)]